MVMALFFGLGGQLLPRRPYPPPTPYEKWSPHLGIPRDLFSGWRGGGLDFFPLFDLLFLGDFGPVRVTDGTMSRAFLLGVLSDFL